MIDNVFAWSVHALHEAARLLDMSYAEVNVWLFLVIWPILTLVLAILVAYYRRTHSEYKLLIDLLSPPKV